MHAMECITNAKIAVLATIVRVTVSFCSLLASSHHSLALISLHTLQIYCDQIVKRKMGFVIILCSLNSNLFLTKICLENASLWNDAFLIARMFWLYDLLV